MRPGTTMGLAVEATVKEVDFASGTVRIIINMSKSDSSLRIHTAPIPAAWTGSFGEFAGGYPAVGSTVLATQGQGGVWSILSYAPSNDVFNNSNTIDSRGFKKNLMSALKPGRHLIQVRNNIRHITDPDIGFQFGDPEQFVHTDPGRGIHSVTLDSKMSFTEAHRSIIGPVFRDIQANATRNISGSALSSHEYQDSLVPIGLDTRTRPGDSFTRNPPYVESREIVYEFSDSFGFTNDQEEESIYDGELIPSAKSFFSRSASRADVLSLSLIEPNQLIEIIKGTVVDIYGNTVDLNRTIIPNGLVDSLSLRDAESSFSNTFKALRQQARKGIAMHFEINARKEEVPDLNNLDFLESGSDFARTRSRFFIDVDKEGQFRMNVPSSSETGNIGLTVRHENYSSVSASANDTDPREFVRNVDNQDIFLDSFGKGAISLSGPSDGDLSGFAAPTDRLTGNPIKLGTVFHDISNTLELHNLPDGILPVPIYPSSKLNQVAKITEIFSPEIIVSGEGANAGGRSGTITMDGMLSMSIGANTVDRQSLWIDLQGGVIANIGRDVNDISYAARFDGDILLNIGGTTPSDDSRFSNLNNAYRPGALDLRVAAGGRQHIIRIDETGVRIHSVGEVDIVSEGTLKLESRQGDVIINGESIILYGNDRGTGRTVMRNPGRSIR